LDLAEAVLAVGDELAAAGWKTTVMTTALRKMLASEVIGEEVEVLRVLTLLVMAYERGRGDDRWG